MASRNDIIAAARAAFGAVTVLDRDQFDREQNGGRPDDLRPDLRNRWQDVYRQALANGRSDIDAWAAAWRAVQSAEQPGLILPVPGPPATDPFPQDARRVRLNRNLRWHDPGRGFFETRAGTDGLLVRSLRHWPLDPHERGALLDSQRRGRTPLFPVYLTGHVGLLEKSDFDRLDRHPRQLPAAAGRRMDQLHAGQEPST